MGEANHHFFITLPEINSQTPLKIDASKTTFAQEILGPPPLWSTGSPFKQWVTKHLKGANHGIEAD